MPTKKKDEVPGRMPPLDILKARKWNVAFFTTYSLGIAFFEAYVLPRLDPSRCKVWIVADADGYRASLMERRAEGVGYEYSLVPIEVAGVFHPKCVYLGGPEGDLLCVGSGNLTFGGFGRNLEVLEVLRPDSAPAAFTDFADFLDDLIEREPGRFASRSWMRDLAKRARAAAKAPGARPTPTQPRLLHSVNQPIAEQLISRARLYGKFSRLTVLSPFFDPKGAAVKKLADALKVRQLTIGLPSNKGALSTFPFALARKWPTKIRAVKPNVANANRTLHAKWIELVGDKAQLRLTGSVNATDAALWSTDNVEVGVLRIDKPDAPSPAAWKTVPIPQKTESLEIRANDARRVIVVDATITSGGALRGALLSSRDLSGTWKGRIFGRGGAVSQLNIVVGKDGNFTCELSDSDLLAKAAALQIMLRRGEDTARGWVQNEPLLSLPSELNPIVRYLAAADSVDADSALIEQLSRMLIEHVAPLFLQPLAPRSLQGARPAGDAKPEIEIPIELLWSPRGTKRDPFFENMSESGRHAMDRLFTSMRHRMLGAGKAPEADVDEPDEDQDVEQQRRKPKNGAPPPKDPHEILAALLDSLDRRMKDLLYRYEDDKKQMQLYGALLVAWLEMKLFLLARLRERTRALFFLGDWITRAARVVFPKIRESALGQHFCAALLLLLLASSDREEDAARPAQLRETLDSSSMRSMSQRHFIQIAETSPLLAQSEFLLGSDRRSELPDAVRKLFAVQTTASQLSEVMRAYQSDAPIPSELPIFVDKLGQDLYRALTHDGPVKLVRVAPSEQARCAHCHAAFTGDAAIDFEQRRFARCTHCKKFTVRL